MAKNTKNTRSRRPSMGEANPRSYSELVKREQQNASAAVVAVPTPTPKKVVTPTQEERNEATMDWATEYGQVFKDLRQLIVTSVALFILMIVLGFVL